MDKFGIFNLLNSFFPLNSQKSQNSSSASGLAGSLLSSLGKSLLKPNDTQEENSLNIKKDLSAHSTPLPLQRGMLSTINSHDEFVKRVVEKNKISAP